MLGNWTVFSAQTYVVSKKKKRSSTKLSLIFRPQSQIQRFFPPKIRWSPKKKVFAEIESNFSAEIPNSKVFSAQNQVVSKQKTKKTKKKIFAEIESAFSAEIRNSNVWGPLFSYGGAIFNFSQKIGLKNTKNVRFCILHKPMATLLLTINPLTQRVW